MPTETWHSSAASCAERLFAMVVICVSAESIDNFIETVGRGTIGSGPPKNLDREPGFFALKNDIFRRDADLRVMRVQMFARWPGLAIHAATTPVSPENFRAQDFPRSRYNRNRQLARPFRRSNLPAKHARNIASWPYHLNVPQRSDRAKHSPKSAAHPPSFSFVNLFPR